MSYSYEIGYRSQDKSYNLSKHVCSSHEIISHTFIFEIILKDNANNFRAIRKIKKTNQGSLLSSDDNIVYSNIERYKLTVLDADNPDKSVVIKRHINHSLPSNTFQNNNIYIEILQASDNSMGMNYYISFD